MSIFFNNDWYEYSLESWRGSNAPPQLHPEKIYTDPVKYDMDVYKFLEEKYSNQICSMVDAAEVMLTSQPNFPNYYIDYWNNGFNESSLWKQIIPFLVFGRFLNVDEQSIHEFGKIFVFGQAIPSIVVDKILDENTNNEKSSDLKNQFLYVIISIINSFNSLAQIKSYNLIEIYSSLISSMYEKMWTEHRNRYLIPELSDNYIDEYLNGDSRLLSSVFFSIGIESAYKLSGVEIPADLKRNINNLRKVRQLNDELLDFEDDLLNGLITSPILLGLQNPELKGSLEMLINKLWQNNSKIILKRISNIVHENKYIQYLAQFSYELLLRVFDSIRNNFGSKKAFEISLLLNIRIALLVRLELNDWHDVDKSMQYSPSFSKI
jgi:hypothetical protein